MRAIGVVEGGGRASGTPMPEPGPGPEAGGAAWDPRPEPPAIDDLPAHFYGAPATWTDAPDEPSAGMDGLKRFWSRRDRQGLASRRLLVLPAIFILIVAVLPWAAEWLQWTLQGRPHFVTEIVSSAITLVLGWWILTLLGPRAALHHPPPGRARAPHAHRSAHRARQPPRARARPARWGSPGPAASTSRSRCCYMDVDHLKQLNDRHGHAAGDETLRALGAVLRSCSRLGTDVAYRVGGDEFVMSVVADPVRGASRSASASARVRGSPPNRSSLSLGRGRVGRPRRRRGAAGSGRQPHVPEQVGLAAAHAARQRRRSERQGLGRSGASGAIAVRKRSGWPAPAGARPRAGATRRGDHGHSQRAVAGRVEDPVPRPAAPPRRAARPRSRGRPPRRPPSRSSRAAGAIRCAARRAMLWRAGARASSPCAGAGRRAR